MAEIVGYIDSEGNWRSESDTDWRPPRDPNEHPEDWTGQDWLIRLDRSDPRAPENTPEIVSYRGWLGDWPEREGFPTLADVEDYYFAVYRDLAE